MLTEEEHQKRREGWFISMFFQRTCGHYTDPSEWPTYEDAQANPEAARARFYAWYDATQRAENPTLQKTKQEKQEKAPHDWEGSGADWLIFKWLEYYATPLPPRGEEGYQADLERAVGTIFLFVGRRCPSETTIRDHIKKCIGIHDEARQKAGFANRPKPA